MGPCLVKESLEAFLRNVPMDSFLLLDNIARLGNNHPCIVMVLVVDVVNNHPENNRDHYNHPPHSKKILLLWKEEAWCWNLLAKCVVVSQMDEEGFPPELKGLPMKEVEVKTWLYSESFLFCLQTFRLKGDVV
jgi:hypothetical protein